MLSFRNSRLSDIDAMERIANEGKALLKRNGISQWQRGTYPDRALFISDVGNGIGYVVTDDEDVAAVCAVTFTIDESYNHLLSGAWLTPNDGVYATIHRSAVGEAFRGRHIIGFLFDSVADLAASRGVSSIRIDTHPDNIAMQRALVRSGFIKCGEFNILEGDEAGDLRYAYERML